MKKSTLKSVMNRLCLIFLILLCSVFTSENAFSQNSWKKDNIKVILSNDKKAVIFQILIYEYLLAPEKYGYVSWCMVSFSTGETIYEVLMRVSTIRQTDMSRTWLQITNKRINEKINLLNCINHAHGAEWPDGIDLDVVLKGIDGQELNGSTLVTTKKSYLKLKWLFPVLMKPVKYFKFNGLWLDSGKGKGEVFNARFTLDQFKSNSNTMKKTPSELQTVISENVYISKDTDGIIITGTEVGKEIKVYTVSGAVLKTVAANDDVVNIKLPKNQIYIVKVGQAHYKVAL